MFILLLKKIFYVSGSKQYHKKRGIVNSSTSYNQDGAGLKHQGS